MGEKNFNFEENRGLNHPVRSIKRGAGGGGGGVPRPGGGPRDLGRNVTAIRNEDGSVRCVVVLGVDLTEWLRADQELAGTIRRILDAGRQKVCGQTGAGSERLS